MILQVMINQMLNIVPGHLKQSRILVDNFSKCQGFLSLIRCQQEKMPSLRAGVRLNESMGYTPQDVACLYCGAR